jgi:peptidoglycan/xylan/chitin deacetylase (PgdA/CDA1 family)
LTNSLLYRIRGSYEKNWPEIHAAATGTATRFIYSSKPNLPDDVVPIFCYHELDKASFESDLVFLSQNGYQTIDAQALVDHVNGNKEAPRNSVVLSIDDGARSLFDVGLPLLRAYSMQAVAFIAPRFHRDDREVSAIAGQRLCSWRELSDMHASGCVDIQSHTYEHRYVPRWPEPIPITGEDPSVIEKLRGPSQSIAEDFHAAKVIIEERLGKTVRHMAFVKYVGSKEAVEIGKTCGFESFWWGYLPYHDGNRPGRGANRIIRVDGWYLQRLPGIVRRPLSVILKARYGARIPRFMRRRSGDQDQ